MAAHGEHEGFAPKVPTAYVNVKSKAQTQKPSGAETKGALPAEYTRIEKWDSDGEPFLEEWQGNSRLQGKTAIITGGVTGIGKSVVLLFVREGARVTINYLPEEQREADELKRLAGEEQVHLCPGDLEDDAFVRRLVEEHCNRFDGSVSILVNNAGKQFPAVSLEELDLRNAESTFRTNVLAMIALTKCALPRMKRGAVIVNSANVVAFKGCPSMVDFSSTKGAIVSFTRALAEQLASRGIRVNAVAPGPVYAPPQPTDRSKETKEAWDANTVPWPPRSLQPADIGPSYVFLADNASANGITGQVLHVNGGAFKG